MRRSLPFPCKFSLPLDEPLSPFFSLAELETEALVSSFRIGEVVSDVEASDSDCESLFVSDSGDTCLVGAGFSTVGGVVESSFTLELTALGEVPPVFSTLVPALATGEEVAASVA